MLGIHEYLGHGHKGVPVNKDNDFGYSGWGDATNEHRKTYELQMKHPTFKNTTNYFQNKRKENYEYYRKKETGK